MKLETHQITRLLQQVRQGNREAANLLFEHLHADMRRLAAYHMKAESPGHTLQPTALVHEVFLKAFSGTQVDWRSRAHFFAVVSQNMRHILVDHARRKRANKRGAGGVRITFERAEIAGRPDEDLVALHEALEAMAKTYQGPAQVVELKFFGGLTDREMAEVLGVSQARVRRDWEFGRTWLYQRLKGTTP